MYIALFTDFLQPGQGQVCMSVLLEELGETTLVAGKGNGVVYLQLVLFLERKTRKLVMNR